VHCESVEGEETLNERHLHWKMNKEIPHFQ